MVRTFYTSRAKFHVDGATICAHGVRYTCDAEESAILAEAFDPECFPQSPDHWAESIESILCDAGVIVWNEEAGEYMSPEAMREYEREGRDYADELSYMHRQHFSKRNLGVGA